MSARFATTWSVARSARVAVRTEGEGACGAAGPLTWRPPSGLRRRRACTTALREDRAERPEEPEPAGTAIAAKEATEKAAAAKSRWALVNEKGEIKEQSGGLKVIDCYTTNDNC